MNSTPDAPELPPLPEPRTRGPTGNALYDCFDLHAYARAAIAARQPEATVQSDALRWQELAIQCLKDALKDVEAVGVELPRHGIDVLGYFINRLNARQAEPVAEVTGRIDSGCTILALVDLPAMAPEPLDIAQALTQALQVCGIGKGLAGRVESEFQLRLAAASPQSETPK